MSRELYVGNLPYTSTEADVKELFEEFGEVHNVKLIADRETQKPRGFGFVKMDDEGADNAVRGMDGQEYGGRRLTVNEARGKQSQPRETAPRQ